MDFELTRRENDERLLPELEAIRTAENIKVLVPFAKAYLGMFYVIDSELEEKEKLRLLANNELADAIFAGFIAGLKKITLPTSEEIGHAAAKKNEYAEGYVVLAALDLLTKDDIVEIENVSDSVLDAAIGFHFTNKANNFHNRWFNYLYENHKEKIIPALSKYWIAMLKNNANYIPGRNYIFSEMPDVEITKANVLFLLQHWQNCKAKTLFQLLQLAFQYADAHDFLKICEEKLSGNKLSEKSRLYWLASAYFLAPEKYFSHLSTYAGRVKLKIMPLLDFIVVVLKKEKIISFSDSLIVQLARMTAPIFPPQHHVYGSLGSLDINSKNVMLLFYQLAQSTSKNAVVEITSLRKARVMKIYSAVIDNLLEIHRRKNNDTDFEFPDFEQYIKKLVDDDCLQGRSNKFDLR